MELLVWIRDKHIDAADRGTELDLWSYKQGHVITAQPDGWPWTDAERNHPDWIIIHSPILNTHADLLTLPQINPNSDIPRGGPMRAKKLNLVALGIDPDNPGLDRRPTVARGLLVAATVDV